MLLVVACVSGIFGLQYYINSDVNDDSNKSSGNTAVSIFSAIQIVVLNMVYSDMAISLNDNENHRSVPSFHSMWLQQYALHCFLL